MLASFMFAHKKAFSVITLKIPQNDRLHAYQSAKNTDVATKRLRTQLTLSLTTSVGEAKVVNFAPV